MECYTEQTPRVYSPHLGERTTKHATMLMYLAYSNAELRRYRQPHSMSATRSRVHSMPSLNALLSCASLAELISVCMLPIDKTLLVHLERVADCTLLGDNDG